MNKEKVFLCGKCNKQFKHSQSKFKHEQSCCNEKNRLKWDGIVGPPGPLYERGEEGGSSKNWVTLGGVAGVPNVLLKREDKHEKGGGVDEAMEGCHFFITLQFNNIYSVCCKSKVSIITFRFFSLLLSHARFSSKSL